MDKKVILAVAGSGKTTAIIDKLNLVERVLLMTYTTENRKKLTQEIIGKFGYFPSNISLFGFFEFLFQFCYRPFQIYNINGIDFSHPNKFVKYFSNDGRIYSNRISKFLIDNKTPYINRINNYFDIILIDEIQDFASYDFEFILSLSKAKLKIYFYGDFFQHTFNSSLIGNKLKNLFSNFEQYKNMFLTNDFIVDTTQLAGSWRCTSNVCEFISDNLEINIFSNNTNCSEVILIEEESEINRIMKDNGIIKLFYQTHYKYDCISNNWGNSKGLTYNNVCVVLNANTYKFYKKKELYKLPSSTLNKLYVACSRSKNNLYFIEEKKLKNYLTK